MTESRNPRLQRNLDALAACVENVLQGGEVNNATEARAKTALDGWLIHPSDEERRENEATRDRVANGTCSG
jgi:hypothetical protein